MPNTEVTYRYRDNANNKFGGRLVLEGSLTREQYRELMDAMHNKRYFIPEPVGLPNLDPFGFVRNEQRHRWHEMVWVEVTDAEAGPDEAFPLPVADLPTTAQLVAAFQAVDWTAPELLEGDLNGTHDGEPLHL